MDLAVDLAALTGRAAPGRWPGGTMPVSDELAGSFAEQGWAGPDGCRSGPGGGNSTALAWMRSRRRRRGGGDGRGRPADDRARGPAGAPATSGSRPSRPGGDPARWVEAMAVAADGFDVLLERVPISADLPGSRRLAGSRPQADVATTTGSRHPRPRQSALHNGQPQWSGVGEGHGHSPRASARGPGIWSASSRSMQLPARHRPDRYRPSTDRDRSSNMDTPPRIVSVRFPMGVAAAEFPADAGRSEVRKEVERTAAAAWEAMSSASVAVRLSDVAYRPDRPRRRLVTLRSSSRWSGHRRHEAPTSSNRDGSPGGVRHRATSQVTPRRPTVARGRQPAPHPRPPGVASPTNDSALKMLRGGGARGDPAIVEAGELAGVLVPNSRSAGRREWA